MGNFTKYPGVEKIETYIPGFDLISEGGLPAGRTTLVAGTAGSAKTVFAMHFLVEGIINGNEGGVFVTFEESPADIRENVKGFGWDVQKWETEGKFAFVDASPDPEVETFEAGEYDLGALLARIEHAIHKVDAKRVALDSIGSIFTQFADSVAVRRELFRITKGLGKMGVTSIMTAEREKRLWQDKPLWC
ncbi:MAG: ATPase domain-containing protein [Candidatus Electryoneaceae bacterium]|nr:ATPase domain-containing protein [Candidatus Electryoneaceae bacterium]